MFWKSVIPIYSDNLQDELLSKDTKLGSGGNVQEYNSPSASPALKTKTRESLKVFYFKHFVSVEQTQQ